MFTRPFGYIRRQAPRACASLVTAFLAIAFADLGTASPHSPFDARFEAYDSAPTGRIVIHDVDGDPRPDLVTSSFVQLGLPDGRLGPPISHPGGAGGEFVLGDFNDDGRIDLAMTFFTPNSVRVLFGQLGGTFGSPATFPLSSQPTSIDAGDLDGDDVLDIAVSSTSSDNITMLRGLGGGAFVVQAVLPVGLGPTTVRILDMTSDGKEDLLVGDQPAGTVSVYPSNDDFTFSAPIVSSGGVGFSLELARLNSDAHMDVVSISGGLKVRLGRADGTFTLSTPPVSFCGGLLAIGDLNADGRADLAFGGCEEGVSVVPGRGNGTFDPAIPLGPAVGAAGGATGDANGDGFPDLVVTSSVAKAVALFAGTETGALGAVQTEFGILPSPIRVEVADFDGDGFPDLATTHSPISPTQIPVPGQVEIHLGFGDGIFNAWATVNIGRDPYDLAVGHLNADTLPDLVVTNALDSTISILTSTSPGAYSRSDLMIGRLPRDVEIVDLNGDGRLDLLVGVNFDLNLRRLFGNGDGTFGAISLLPVSNDPISSFSTADLNGDNRPDLVVTDWTSAVVDVRFGDGAGGFGSPIGYSTASRPYDVLLADMSHDGVIDLIVSCDTAPRSITILYGTGTGSFGGRIDLSMETASGTTTISYGSTVEVGDFNGDGWGDLAATRWDTHTVGVWLSDGAGGFAARADLGTGGGPRRLAAQDFDLDGKLDLAVTCARRVQIQGQPNSYEEVGNQLTILMNRGEPNVDVPHSSDAPVRLAIDRVAPNPARGPIRIDYTLPLAASTRLSVIDLQGREVAVLSAPGQAGRHQAKWDGHGTRGIAPPGVYFVRVHAGKHVASRRFVLIH